MPLHVLIPTHTTRHLAACLAGLSWQTVAPASVTVSCDGDDPRVGALLESTWPHVRVRLARRHGGAPPLLFTRRPHAGEPRLNQVRNNGLRALDERLRPGPLDLVVVLDGDTVLAPEALAAHAGAADGGADVNIAYRVNLSQAATEGVSAEGLLSLQNLPPGWLGLTDLRDLERRRRRYLRQLALRRLGPGLLVKAHKPKILGGHHAVTVGSLRAVNGYDEGYTGYGYDDDDLSRRVLALRPQVRIAVLVRSALAFHLWHPSRAPASPTLAPGYARFRRGGPVFVSCGWTNPLAQPSPTVTAIATSADERP